MCHICYTKEILDKYTKIANFLENSHQLTMSFSKRA